MNPNLYTQVAEQAAARYVGMLGALRGLLFSSMSQPYSVRSADELRSNATEIGRSYLRGELPLIQSSVRETALESIRTLRSDLKLSPVSEVPDIIDAFVETSGDYLETEIRAQLARDVETVVKRFREYAVEAHLTASSMGFSAQDAYVKLGSTQGDRLRFYFKDRQGRLYPSQKFIRSAWRQTLVTVGAESYLLEAASSGVKKVAVDYPNDPNHQWNGYEFNLSTLSGDPTFTDIRDEVFHPNSNAILKAV